jgi:VanZ family protein
MTPGHEGRNSRLPHALVALYAAAIAYASLQPFGDWMKPLPDTPFWLLAPESARTTNFDVIVNFASYIPLGFFASLLSRRATALGAMLIALVAGAALSFTLETLQWHMPPRYANVVDFAANTLGALAGGMLGAMYGRSPLRTAMRELRPHLVLPGTIGDVGLALLATWFVAQLNPAIPPFALTFDPEPLLGAAAAARANDVAATLIESAQSAFHLLGVGLFVALLVRERYYALGSALLMVGIALLVKGAAATLLLKPAAVSTWLSPGVLVGVAVGVMLLVPATLLPRAAQVAVCAVALLSSLLVPLLAPELMFASAPLTLFNWRYGHLLNFNGLTRIVLVAWPLAAAAWLFALAGKPGWGNADGVTRPDALRESEPDPL